MKLELKTIQDFVLIDKPFGFSTHAPDLHKLGICEIAEIELGEKLFIAQRLDKTTTGTLLLGLTSEAAKQLTENLQKKEVQKVYRFVTDRSSKTDTLTCDLPIDQKPSETDFQRIKRSPFFELWEARPKTGRAHQIRIHASHLGLPILGDQEYGGSPFPHLCLHAWKLKIPGMDEISTPPPIFFDRMGLLKDPELIQWLSEADRRQRLYQFLQKPDQSLRLVHLPEIRIDAFGNQIWVYWYRQNPPNSVDLERIAFFSRFLKKEYFIKYMQDRGKDPLLKNEWQSSSFQKEWQAREGSIEFHFDSDLGQSPGLFLDQSANRDFLKNLSSGKKVLNLFSYTCGFSVAAAVGGASNVTSVDLSKKFLEWGKTNFRLNQLDPEKFEFFASDSQVFLKGALNRQRKFDLIVCDPPSFGRSKTGVFKIEKELPHLLKACWDLLENGGSLLISTNFEKWSQIEFEKRCLQGLRGAQKISVPCRWDFEAPNQDRLMKWVWIKKSN